MIGIEIIIGIVVLILVIVGVAQLKKKVNIKEAINETLTWEKSLYEAFNDPQKLRNLQKYGRPTAKLANEAKSAIYGQIKILREKYDMSEKQALDYVDLLNKVPQLVRTFEMAYNDLRNGDIEFPDFKNGLLKKKYHLDGSAAVDHKFRHPRD